MSKLPQSGNAADSPKRDKNSTVSKHVDLRVRDDVALNEIELYTDVLAALAEGDENVARREIEALLGPGSYG
jgi:hypothetical protein